MRVSNRLVGAKRSSNSRVTTSPAASFESLEPRLLLSGSIEGTLWHDANADGIHDAGETGLSGWTVELRSADGSTVLATQLTADIDINGDGTIDPQTESGRYSLSGLADGSYKVTAVAQDGWVHGEFATATYDVTLSPGQVADNLDFGLYMPASIDGQLFEDMNVNGLHDVGEIGLGRAYLYLYETGTDTRVGTARTGQRDVNGDGTIDRETEWGLFTFKGLAPGVYDIVVRESSLWAQVPLDSPLHTIVVESGKDVTGADIGYARYTSVGGRAFEDLNANGLRDSGEPSHGDWTVELLVAASGAVLATQVVHNIDGYSFDKLLPGEYAVRVVPQATWQRTTPTDSPHHFTLLYRQDATIDFGHRPLVYSIEGTFFEDLNRNGTRDDGEGGIEGWTVELIDPATGAVLGAEALTGSKYSFDDLWPGAYAVREVPQDEWIRTAPVDSPHEVVLVHGEAGRTVDFGFTGRPVEIRGQKFHDLDADGVKDSVETGLDGWTIELVDPATEAVVATQVTASVDLNGDGTIDPKTESGLYAFTDLPPGDYNVREIPQGDWLTSTPGQSHSLTYASTATQGSNGATGLDGAMFCTASPDGKHVYVTSRQTSSIAVYSQNATTGALAFTQYIRNGVDGVDGLGSVGQMTISPDGKHAYAVSQTRGSLAVFSRDAATGHLSFVGAYTDGTDGVTGLAGVTSVVVSPDGNFVYATSYEGQTIVTFGRDQATGQLTLVHVFTDDSGTLDLVFSVMPSPDGRNLYVASSASSSLAVFACDVASGELSLVQTLVADAKSTDPLHGLLGARAVVVSPDGRNVYAMGVYGDGLVVFNRDEITGELTFNEVQQKALGGGTSGTNGKALAISPDGDYVYAIGLADEYLSVFARNPIGGELTHPNVGRKTLRRTSWLAMSPNGFILSTSNYYETLKAIEHDVDVRYDVALERGQTAVRDFGSYGSGSISGQLVDDITMNGGHDPFEMGIDGWRVELVDAATDEVLSSRPTVSMDLNGDGSIDPVAERGLYTFAGVRPGQYTVRLVIPAGWGLAGSAQAARFVSVASGQSEQGIDLASMRLSSISGRAFEDLNGDGVRDPGEPYLDGRTIELLDGAEGGVLATQVTASVDVNGDGTIDPETETGLYSFGELTRGFHYVRQGASSDATLSSPSTPTQLVMLGYGRDATGVDFAVEQAPDAVSGQKWHDINGDGVKDPDEPGLDGWAIELIDASTGALLATRVTASTDLNGDGTIDPLTESGLYTFADLSDGDYLVRPIDQAGWVATTPLASGALTFIETHFNGVDGVDGLDRAFDVKVSPDGRHVYVSGIEVNTIAVFSRDVATGELSFVEVIRQGVNGIDYLARPWSLAVSPDGRNVYATGRDYNSLVVFARNADTGQLTSVQVLRDGTDGVDGLNSAVTVAVSPDGEHVYVCGNDDNAIATFARDTDTGELSLVQVLFDDTDGVNGLGDPNWVTVSPDGRHVYVAAGQDDALGVFSRDEVTGELSFVQSAMGYYNGTNWLNGAQTVHVSPDGNHVYALGDNGRALALFSRDPVTGRLTITGVMRSGVAGLPSFNSSKSIALSPDGLHLYAESPDFSKGVGTFSRNAVTGELSLSAGVEMPSDGQIDVWMPAVSPDGRHVYVTSHYSDALTVFRRYAGAAHYVTVEPGRIVHGDFGAARPVTISGTVFEDVNGDAQRDGAETGIDGVTLELVDASTGHVLASRISADLDINGDGTIDPLTETGLFVFEGLLPGSYTLRLDGADDWVQTSMADTITFLSGGGASGVELGVARGCSISGRTFEDLNSDGLRDAGEVFKRNLTVELVDPATGTVLETQDTANVDLNGDGTIDAETESALYAFTRLRAGEYLVRVIPWDHWLVTPLASQGRTVTLAYDQDVTDVDLGIHTSKVELRGQVWHDANANGVRDAGEVGVDGVRVEMTDPATGRLLDSEMSTSYDVDGDGTVDPETETGLWSTRSVPAGNCEIHLGGTPSWVLTYPADPYLLSPGPGETITDLDIGVARAAGVLGQVFEDVNGDGVRGGSETTVNGVVVQIIDPLTGALLARATTEDVDIDGNGTIDQATERGLYTLGDVPPGTYDVRAVLGKGWVPTGPAGAIHQIQVTYGQYLTGMDFGYRATPGEIHGQVVNDLNNDGVRDPGEAGLDGWVVELLNPVSGDVIAIALTESDDVNGDGEIDPKTEAGLYVFADVAPGEYGLRSGTRTPWTATMPVDGMHTLLLSSGQTLGGFDFGRYNPPALEVISSSIQPGESLSGAGLTVTLAFDRILEDSEIRASAFGLTGAANGYQAVAAWQYEASSSTLTMTYHDLPDDQYTLMLFTTPWNVSFDWDCTEIAHPPVAAAAPAGSMIYSHALAGSITAGDSDLYTLDLHAGRTLTLALSPATGLLASIELRDPAGAVVGSASSSATGDNVVLQTAPVATAGTYRITVTAPGDTTGHYTLETTLNAAVELEDLDGASNNSPPLAQDLGGAFIDLPGGSADRGAVLGSADGWELFSESQTQQGVFYPNELTFDFTDLPPCLSDVVVTISGIADLGNPNESLTLNANGYTFDLNPTATGAPDGGFTAVVHLDYAKLHGLLFDRAMSFTVIPSIEVDDLGQNELTVTLEYATALAEPDTYAFTLAGAHSATLALTALNDRGIDSQSPITPLVVHSYGPDRYTGVWQHAYYPVPFDLPVGIENRTNHWQVKERSADGFIISMEDSWQDSSPTLDYAGLTLQFQYLGDNLKITYVSAETDAFVYDLQISGQGTLLGGMAPGGLPRGTTVTMDLGPAPEPEMTLELYDASGVLLAAGINGPANVDLAISNVGAQDGQYFARVTGPAGADYSLVITRNAAFNIEPNDATDTAQDLTTAPAVLGYVTAQASGRLFRYDPGANVIIELDVADGSVIRTLDSPLPSGPQWSDARSGAGLAVTGTSLLLAARGEPYVYELDPDTGQVIRLLANPTAAWGGAQQAGPFAQALAFSNDSIVLLTQPQSLSPTNLDGMFAFKTVASSTSYITAFREGPYVVKLSDSQFQQARALGLLSDSAAANNFPREQWPYIADLNGVYWLCYEDYGGDWDYKDVMVRVTPTGDGTTRLDFMAGGAGHRNSIIDDNGYEILRVPSMTPLGVLSTTAQTEEPPILVVLDYATGDIVNEMPIHANGMALTLQGALAAWGDTLYGVSQGSSLYRINPRTGQGTYVGQLSRTPDAPGTSAGMGIVGEELFVQWQVAGAGSGRTAVYDLDTLTLNRTLDAAGVTAIGADGGDSQDVYSFTVQAGATLHVETATPGAGAGQFINTLDPAVEVYDPTGQRVALDDNSAADGRNATLDHVALLDGTYTVRVSAVEGRGTYLLRTTGQDAPNPPPFEVIATDVPDGAVLNALPTHLTVRFSDGVALATLDPSDLAVNGMPAVSVTVIDGRTVRFELPDVSGQGPVHTITLSAAAVLDLQGTPVEAMSMSLTVDTVGPTVLTWALSSTAADWALDAIDSSLWTTGRTAQTVPWAAIDNVTVAFDEPAVALAQDLMLTGLTNGPAVATGPAGSGTGELTWTVTSGGGYLSTDRCALTLAASLTDTMGNPMAGGWRADLNVLVGDINGDGRVSSRDRRALRDAYGSTAGDAAYTIFADLNGDGRISSRDRRILRDNYGRALPDPPPLPAAMAPASLGEMDSPDPSAPSSGSPSDSEDALMVAGGFVTLAAEPVQDALKGSADGEHVNTPLMSMSIQTPSIDLPTVTALLPSRIESISSTPPPVDADSPAASQLDPDMGIDLTDILGEEMDASYRRLTRL